MATAAKVLKSALQRILVQGSEADLEPDEFQDAIDDMNNLMLAYDADGISLGYTLIEDLGDEVTVPLGALRGVIANVAIEISPDYNGTVTAALARAAEAGLQTMRKLGQFITPTEFPSTLPIGSGNEGTVTRFSGNHFYPALEAQILAETTGAISLETGTEAAIND